MNGWDNVLSMMYGIAPAFTVQAGRRIASIVLTDNFAFAERFPDGRISLIGTEYFEDYGKIPVVSAQLSSSHPIPHRWI
jgi:hypothetical protein